MYPDSPLGKVSSYIDTYTPSLLYPIARDEGRELIGVQGELPFKGYDVWNAYELSWLNSKGKPINACGEFILSCETPKIVESKSLKLYLNSFNMSRFDSIEQARQTMIKDLSEVIENEMIVNLFPVEQIERKPSIYNTLFAPNAESICLDNLDVSCEHFKPTPNLLQCETTVQKQVFYSHSMRSKCLVTAQPDWASVFIEYHGPKLVPESLLRYIVSYRDHEEFHEQCAERMFMDITRLANPSELSVFIRYTRRGGIDINPFRTNKDVKEYKNLRTVRQ